MVKKSPRKVEDLIDGKAEQLATNLRSSGEKMSSTVAQQVFDHLIYPEQYDPRITDDPIRLSCALEIARTYQNIFTKILFSYFSKFPII